MISCMEPLATDAAGALLEPGAPGWDAARRPFDRAVDQRPAVIGLPIDERQVVDAVREAGRRELRVVAQCGGRGAARLGSLEDAMLVRTPQLIGVEIDARSHRARVRAGARWVDVAGPAFFLGLAPAAGFASGASVVGTVLGDGMGWLARRHGMAAAGVRTVEYVTSEGSLERSDDLPGDGVITALEIDLHPAEDLYAGALFFSPGSATEVLQAWLEWTATAPPEITSVARIMHFGTGHEVAGMVRGRSFVLVEAAHLGTEAEGAALLDPLRELRAELDTFSMVPPSALGYLHMEPEEPVARLADDGMVGTLPAAAVDELVAAARPPLGSVELRHVGDGRFFTRASGSPTDAASNVAIEAQLALVAAALAPFAA
jgi:FAD/FMN-containing dehydrogenase